MTAGWVSEWEQQGSRPPSGPWSSSRYRCAGPQGGFSPTKSLLLLVIVVAAVLETDARAANAPPADLIEQTLGAVRDCIAKPPTSWPAAWQEEYVNTVRQVIGVHQDVPQYAERLRVIREGFPPYWEALKKGRERSLFEVHRAEIRWYVESLMSAEFPGPEERQKLREQWRGLLNDAAAGLVKQFPFLDPNVVQAAKADYLAKCDRDIEAPLLPILQRSLSEQQIAQLKERWHSLRYARVDLWRQLGGGTATTPKKPQAPSGETHPDYLLTQRSLDQLRGQIWSQAGTVPDYYRDAVAKEIAAQKQRLQSQSEARAQEGRLGVAVWQTEYVSFLLAALLETAETPGNATLRSGESSNDGLQGETHKGR